MTFKQPTPVDNATTQFTFTLCGRPGTCCPVVEQINESEYTIKDDFGGSVRVTLEQMGLMQAVVDHAKAQQTTQS